VATARQMWREGGIRAYFKGLTWGLVGVFPCLWIVSIVEETSAEPRCVADAAIDMSCYHSLKATHAKSTGRDEPGVFASLAFGAASGAIGATSAPAFLPDDFPHCKLTLTHCHKQLQVSTLCK
jgi:solute carrier family 25 phosphate transporter 23/24/25/41